MDYILLALKHIAFALKQQITLLFLSKCTPKNTDLCCSSLPSTSLSNSFQDATFTIKNPHLKNHEPGTLVRSKEFKPD